jgi:hypothetical protein
MHQLFTLGSGSMKVEAVGDHAMRECIQRCHDGMGFQGASSMTSVSHKPGPVAM